MSSEFVAARALLPSAYHCSTWTGAARLRQPPPFPVSIPVHRTRTSTISSVVLVARSRRLQQRQKLERVGERESREMGAAHGNARGEAMAPEQPPPRKPSLPWSVRLQLMGLMGATDMAQRADGTVNRFAFSLADRQARPRPRPDKLGVRSADVTVDASRGLWARVFFPSVGPAQAQPPLPVVVYFHGGGFAFFTPASVPLDAMCARLCVEAGAVVVSVNYRLAPEHPYPAAYDDGVDVLRFLDGDDNNALPFQEDGVAVDLSRCFLAGDSAGGNIAHHVAHRWTSTAATSSPVRIAGIVLIQPFFGGEERTESERRLEGVAPVVNLRRADWAWRAFLPRGADRNHPAAHVTGEAGPEPELLLGRGLFPPAVVVVGGFDPLQDWQRRYAAMLRRKGMAVRVVEFPDAIHGFYVFPELADAGRILTEIKAFVAESSGASASRAAADE